MNKQDRQTSAEVLWRAWCAFLSALFVVTLFGCLRARAADDPQPPTAPSTRVLEDGSVRPVNVYSPPLAGAPVAVALPDGGTVYVPAPTAASVTVSALPSETPAPSVASQAQAERARTGIAASMIGLMLLALRTVLGLLKQSSNTAVWRDRAPWVQWLIIAVVSAAIALLDRWVTGGTWGQALIEMGMAFAGSWTVDKISTIASTNKQIVRLTAVDVGQQPPPPPTATMKGFAMGPVLFVSVLLALITCLFVLFEPARADTAASRYTSAIIVTARAMPISQGGKEIRSTSWGTTAASIWSADVPAAAHNRIDYVQNVRITNTHATQKLCVFDVAWSGATTCSDLCAAATTRTCAAGASTDGAVIMPGASYSEGWDGTACLCAVGSASTTTAVAERVMRYPRG